MAKRRRTASRANGGRSERPADMIDVASDRVRAARRLWNQGRRNDAELLFADAIRQEPNNVQAYVVAARAYAEKFDFSSHGGNAGKTRADGPRSIRACTTTSARRSACSSFPSGPSPAYERAARLPGAGPPTWMELASLYERAHRLDEAEELIERTVRTGFDFPLVCWCAGVSSGGRSSPTRRKRRSAS